MAFCNDCGTHLPDGTKFCANCGASSKPQDFAARAGATEQPGFSPQDVNRQAQSARPGGGFYETATAKAQQGRAYQAPVMPGAPTQADIRDAQENKTMSILAYILFFIPLLTGAHKTSPFAKYHTNQGTVLFLLTLAWSIVYWILTAIFTAILFNPSTWLSGGLGALGAVTTILSLIWIIPTLLCVVGIVNAAQGKMTPLPVIGKFSIIK